MLYIWPALYWCVIAIAWFVQRSFGPHDFSG